jgi:tubulin beta
MFDSRCLFSDAGDLNVHGKILTASCLMRGENISICELESTISKMKTKNSGAFVEWIPDNMMNTICKVPAVKSDISGTFIANSTAQNQSFSNLLNNFEKMLKAKAYVHWYTAEGMDIEEFREAGSNVADLISEYQQY